MRKRILPAAAVLALAAVTAVSGTAGKTYSMEGGTSSACYEVFVWSFYDSDHDGIGDLKGLLEKLDYINDGNTDTTEDLGCDMLWTMPVFPSPTYHKYDVTDYMAIDPVYGTMDDFNALLQACHERGIRWILDLPVNHTSTEHPWFVQAAEYLSSLGDGEEPSAAACRYFDYYHFAREGAAGWENLPGTDWYYEARFWSGMPDLNLDSAMVRQELKDIMAFWLEKGADGFRLDAVTSYYSEDIGRSIDFTRWLTDTAKGIAPACYLVGEAWTDQETYTSFYSSGIDSMFDFAFAGAEGIIAKTANGKKGADVYAEKLAEEEAVLAQYENAVNAPFYTNHDMARSAGYFTRDEGRKAKTAQALNLLMPGNVFLYYGEELGMKGSGKDENKRAPMYWSSDPDEEGICDGPPDMDEVQMKYPSWSEQKADEYSIFSYVRNLIHLREQYPVIARGRTVPAEELSGKEICAMCREAEGLEPVLLVINTSDETQEVELTGAYADFNVLGAVVRNSSEDVSEINEKGVFVISPGCAAVLEK